MDVIEELKFLGKFTKKKYFLGGGVGSGGGVRVGGRGVRVDVNVELKFLQKLKKKIGGGGQVRGVRLVGGGSGSM